MPWLSRKDYELLIRRNDDRDFAATRREMEHVLSEIKALRTYCQRQFKALEGFNDEPDPPALGGAMPVPGAWR